MRTSCELGSLFILNPDDYERGQMSPNGTQSFGTLCVVYKISGHLKWVSFCLLKTTSIMRSEDRGRRLEAYEIGVVLSE